MPPDDVVSLVKDANLRGRGGAGFPTGMKWSFVPKDNPNPTYLVVNGDESEPGTCKDMPLMMASPHTLVEGVIIASYAIKAKMAFIYIRGEVLHVVRRVQQAVREAYSAGYIGKKNILGSGYDLDVVVHAGAGATSVARRRLCWIPWRGVVVSLVCARLSRPLPACTPVRRSLTTSSPSRRCRRSCATARNGSSPWAPRSPMVSPSTLCLGTWLTLGSMRPRWHYAASAPRHLRWHATGT